MTDAPFRLVAFRVDSLRDPCPRRKKKMNVNVNVPCEDVRFVEGLA